MQVILEIKAKPNSKQTKFELKDGIIIAHLAAQPIDGEANAELVRALSKALKITQKQIEVKVGASGRNKLVKITSDFLKEELLTRIK